MHKLIITADDYGTSKGVNSAIEQGIEAGIITATNVMTNMDFYTDAVRLRETNASVGLHWALCFGKPVCKANEIPSLVNSQGVFFDLYEFRKRYRKGLISDWDIRQELIAQYQRFEELLGAPDYWNTHQNIHVDFRIFQLLVQIAKELGINKMRSNQRIYVPSSNHKQTHSLKWRIMEPIKSRIIDHWQDNAHAEGIASPEGVIACLNYDDVIDPQKVFTRIQWKDHQLIEHVIHPSIALDSEYFGELSDQRLIEYQIFTSANTLSLLQEQSINLVNYDAVQLQMQIMP